MYISEYLFILVHNASFNKESLKESYFLYNDMGESTGGLKGILLHPKIAIEEKQIYEFFKYTYKRYYSWFTVNNYFSLDRGVIDLFIKQ